jgi:hypothetical protein
MPTQISHFAYFFPFLFIGMAILVTYTISKMGWTDLAARYETEPTFEGTRVGIISATVNRANYKNSLVLKYNQDGFYLRPVIFFRLFHKPLFIPWSEIKEVRTKKILFFSSKELIIGTPWIATILIDNSTFNKIQHNFPMSVLS